MAPTFMPTPVEDIPKIRDRARAAFRSGRTRSIAFRKEQIAQVAYLLKDNEEHFKEALKEDLGRPYIETEFFDLTGTYGDLLYVYHNVEKWAATQKVEFSISALALKPTTKAEPKGTVLIIAPFNYPTFLTLGPLGGAIAGGNAAVIKPSELTPTVSALLAELLPKYVDPELYHIVNGGIPETTKLLELQWDHIFYTGNGRVGRIIAAAAAKYLTPLTLELGGKNPVVIDPSNIDVKAAARRILWGRFSNAGQICLSPEYVLVPAPFQDTLIEALKEAYHTFYPDGPESSTSFSRIVSEASVYRIKAMLDETRGTIVLGGKVDPSKKYVAPTIVSDVQGDDALMEQEIFGPVLAIVPVRDVDEAIDFITARDHPLTIYIFSNDKAFQTKVSENTKSGSVMCNDTIVGGAVPGFPISGVGASGYGYNTGKLMFDQFTHIRPTIDSPSWVDALGFGCRYPPYKYIDAIRFTLPGMPPRPGTKHGALGRLSAFWG